MNCKLNLVVWKVDISKAKPRKPITNKPTGRKQYISCQYNYRCSRMVRKYIYSYSELLNKLIILNMLNY